MTTNLEDMKTEMVVFLRNSDILSINQRGVTTTSNVFVATGAQTVFTLSNNVVRNIRYATIDGTAQNAYIEYTPDYKVSGTTLTFETGMSGSELVDIGFDYSPGTIEKVWADYPQLEYLPDSVPRVGFEIIGIRTRPLSIGNSNWFSDALFSIKLYDSNLQNIDGFLTTIRSAVKTAQNSFFHFQIVRPSNIGPSLLHDIKSKTRLSGKVFEKAIDLVARYNFET